MILNTLYLKISWKQVEQVWTSAQIPQKKIIRHIYIYYIYIYLYIYIILQYLYQLGVWKLGGTPLKKKSTYHPRGARVDGINLRLRPAQRGCLVLQSRIHLSGDDLNPSGDDDFYGESDFLLRIFMVIRLWWFLVISGDIPEFLWWFFADCEKRIEKAQLNHMKINRYQQSGKSSKRIEVHWSTIVWK